MATFNEMLEGIERGEWWRRPWWPISQWIRIGVIRPWEVQIVSPVIEPCGFCNWDFDFESARATDWERSDKSHDAEAMRLIEHFRQKREAKREEHEAFLARVPMYREMDRILANES